MEGLLSSQLSKLRLETKSAVSLDTQKSADYVLHVDSQSCEKCGGDAKLAASSSNLTIRIYNRQTLAPSSTISGDNKVITDVKFSRSDDNLLYTSSADTVIKCWDLRTDCKDPAQKFEGYGIKNLLSAIDISSGGRILCGGTEQHKEDAYLIFWDVRQSSTLGVYSDSHFGDITQVCFHDNQANTLATCSTDGLVCTFDISEGKESDALQTTFNCESSVARVGWCGKDFTDVYSLTDIGTYHIWDTIEMDPIIERTDLREKQPGVDYLVDCFQTSDHQLHLIAADYKGNVTMVQVGEEEIHCDLPVTEAHNGVIRCAHWDKQTGSLVTGGEDSMLCLWSNNSASQTSINSHKVKPNLKKKTHSGGRKPYTKTH